MSKPKEKQAYKCQNCLKTLPDKRQAHRKYCDNYCRLSAYRVRHRK